MGRDDATSDWYEAWDDWLRARTYRMIPTGAWPGMPVASSDRLDAALAQMTLVTPRQAAELRRLVYG